MERERVSWPPFFVRTDWVYFNHPAQFHEIDAQLGKVLKNITSSMR